MDIQKIQIWVRPLTAPRFRMEASDSEKVSSFRDRIVTKLKSSGLFIPAEAQLVLRGKVLKGDLTLADCAIASTDQIVFLYDLTAKPPKQPVAPPSPIPTAAPIAQAAAPLPRMPPAYQPVIVPNVAPAAAPSDPNNIRGMIGNIMANFNHRVGPGPVPAPVQVPSQPLVPPPAIPQPQNPPQASTPPRAPQPQQQPLPVPNQPVLVMNVPLPDRTALDEMLAMGFPEIRARRALLLNGLSVEESLDWLLIHGQATHLDNPQLNSDEVRQILRQIEAMRQGNDEEGDPMEEEQRASSGPTATDRLRDAIANDRCTFSVTGRTYQMQAWYYCYTCGFVDSEGVCESCRNVCHKGHKVSERIKESTFFCDCGASGQCKCCTPPPNR